MKLHKQKKLFKEEKNKAFARIYVHDKLLLVGVKDIRVDLVFMCCRSFQRICLTLG